MTDGLHDQFSLRRRPAVERLVDKGFKNISIIMASVVAIVLFSIILVVFWPLIGLIL